MEKDHLIKLFLLVIFLGLWLTLSNEAKAYHSSYSVSIGTPYFGITYSAGRYYPYSRFYSYGYFPNYRSLRWYDSWLWRGSYPYSVYPAPSYSTWKRNNQVATEIAEQKYYRHTVVLEEFALQEKKKKETSAYKNQSQDQTEEETPEIIETPSEDPEKKPKESVEMEKGTVVATYY